MSINSSNLFNSIEKEAFTIMPILPLRKLNPSKAEFPKADSQECTASDRPGLLTSPQLFHYIGLGHFIF